MHNDGRISDTDTHGSFQALDQILLMTRQHQLPLECKSSNDCVLGACSAFLVLDQVVEAAGRYGVRLVIPMVNFEEEVLGMSYFVNRAHGKGPKELFFASNKVRP